MSVEIHTFITSDTIDSAAVQVFNRDENEIVPPMSFVTGEPVMLDIGWSNNFDTSNRGHGTFEVDTPNGSRIISTLLSGDIDGLREAIDAVLSDNFFSNSLVQLKISGINVRDVSNLARKSKSGARVADIFRKIRDIDQDLVIPVSYVKPKTLLDRYRIFNDATKVKKIPFENYDTNETNEGTNCFYNYVCQTYKKIGKKAKEKFNVKEGVTLSQVIDFCERYKIKAILYNLAEKCIYANNYDHNKNHPNLVAVIGNNHFYPKKPTYNTWKPQLPSVVLKKHKHELFSDKSSIIIERGMTVYGSEGKVNSSEITGEKIDTCLFKHLHPNFNFKDDIIKISPLAYYDINIEKIKFEYDQINSYYNQAYNYIKGDYPIFSCFDLWQPYKNGEINSNTYYTLTNAASSRLQRYGLRDNFRTGFMVEYLLKSELIKKKDIECYKEPSYLGSWATIKERISDMCINTVRYELGIEDGENIPDELVDKYIKKLKLKKKFSVYNGLLGRTSQTVEKRIHHLDESEYELLNHGYDQECWQKQGDQNGNYTYISQYTTYKEFNNTTIYNNIIEHTNLSILKNIMFIKKQTGLMPLKICTDGIAYTQEVDLRKSTRNQYKLETDTSQPFENKQGLTVKNKQLLKFRKTVGLRYYDAMECVQKIIDNDLSKITENVSYIGAPGTGKTTTVIKNHKYDHAAAVSNVCAINISTDSIQATTLYSLFKQWDPDKWHETMSKLSRKTLWIDEFSMIDRKTWGFMVIACIKYRAKLIISGDINQIGPVREQKVNTNNVVFRTMMGKQTELTKDWRNDEGIIELRDLVKTNDMNQIYNKFNDITTNDDLWIDYDRHLCQSNKMKQHVNDTIMERRNFKFEQVHEIIEPKPVAFGEISEEKPKKVYKHLDVSNGVILRCVANKKGNGIFKSDLWRVIERRDEGYELQNISRNYTQVFEHKLMNMFEPGFAITVHSAQGLTIKEDLCIHEISKMIGTDTDILYTGITRAREYSKLHFYKNNYPKGTQVRSKTPVNGDEIDIYHVGQTIKMFK